MSKEILIVELLNTPDITEQWSDKSWDLVIQQGYAAGVLARMYAILRDDNQIKNIPIHVLWHLESAYKLYQAHRLDIEIEMKSIVKALHTVKLVPIFLKGAGYIATKDKCHDGRLFADVDIYLSKDNIALAEQVLHWQGWGSKELDQYDEQYYRKWMHEIPPMSHRTRGVTLDVHHSLIPLTSKISMDNNKLANNAEVALLSGYLTLAAEDRILHSAIHLLLDGEFTKGFRDISDLDMMLREFSENDILFWQKLVNRAENLGVSRVLYYCFMSTQKILNTPVPDIFIKQVQHAAPNIFINKIMLTCFYAVLLPLHSSCKPMGLGLATNILFIRSHWLKMPIHILIPHLCHKAFVTPFTQWRQKKHQDNLAG